MGFTTFFTALGCQPPPETAHLKVLPLRIESVNSQNIWASFRVALQSIYRILALFMTLTVCGCTDSSTSTAWNNTTWGMKIDDLRRVVPETVKLKTPQTFIGGEARFGVENFILYGRPFTVYFIISESDGLKEVVLRPAKSESPSMVFSELERLLTEKYGKPNVAQGLPGIQSFQRRSILWNLKQMTITLNYLQSESVEFTALSYSPPKKGDLNKL
jgi:hypothetical protein